MEITKREVIASITIVAIMLLLGFVISGKISEKIMDKNEIYNKALKIEDTELFKYGMNTNVGNAFIYGELEAVDTVSYPEIDGEYMSLEKKKEVYTMHTKRVKSGKSYVTRTYWTWDYAGKETLQSNKVKFKGVEFNSSKIILPSTNHIKTIKTSSTVRYKYYGSEIKHTGTMFAYLANDDIGESKAPFYKDKDIEQTYSYVINSGFKIIIFWIIWIALIITIVYKFYYLDNYWLE